MASLHIPPKTGPGNPHLLSSGTRIPLSFFLSLFFALTLLGTLLYCQALPCPFLWDEYGLILDNAAQGTFEWKNLPALFGRNYFQIPGRPGAGLDMPYYRPVTVLFHGLTYRAFGLAPLAFHVESLFLHIGNALLLFLLFSILFADAASPPSGELQAVALTGTLLFFVHPRNVETVCIIANQTGLLCTFFSLLSLCCWAILLSGNKRTVFLYGSSLFFLFLACLTKESGYTVPLIHTLVFGMSSQQKNKRNILLLSGYFLMIGIPLFLRHLWLPGPSMETTFLSELSKQGPLISHLAGVLNLLLHQLGQWFFPLTIHLFQYSFFPDRASLHEILFPLFTCMLLTALLWKRKRILAFGAGWFLLCYFPSSNLVPMGALPSGGLKTGAHHLYMAQAGLAWLVAAALFLSGRRICGGGKRRQPRVISWLLTGVLVVLLGFQTFLFSAFFRSADRFYQGVLARNPTYSGAWLNYGWHKFFLEKKPGQAEQIYLDGLDAIGFHKNPQRETRLMWNLLHLYRKTGRWDEAETLVQCVMEPWSRNPRGNIYFWKFIGHLEERKESVTLPIPLSPEQTINSGSTPDFPVLP